MAVCLSLLLAPLAESHAATTVPPGLINDPVWYKTNSPYYISGNVLVATLTIQPGVRVYFQGNYEFQVQGVLKALGETNDPIIFYRPGTAGWQGIFFNYSSPGSELYCCVISNSVNSGVRILDSSPYLENCTIAYNSAPSGGGIWADIAQGDLILRKCTIANNQSGKDGGGIFAAVHTNRLIAEDCDIRGNLANPGHSVYSWTVGGGLWAEGESTTRMASISLSRCLIRSNICSVGGGTFGGANSYGGGMICQAAALSLNNCTLAGNIAQAYSGTSWYPYAYGGGLELSGGCSAKVANCIFSYNALAAGSGVHGGGVYVEADSSAAFLNCTFAYNAPEAVESASSNVGLTNSIVYFNNSGGSQILGTSKVAYCDVQNGFAGTGNINYGPIFYSANNLTIVSGSRCVDAGNPASAYNDTCFSGSNPPFSLGTERNDIGAHGGPGAWGWIQGDEPRVAAQPQSQSSCLGQSVTFSVFATGSGPLGYQWFFNGAPLSGNTGTNLTLSPLQKTDAGAYWVVVSNVFGIVTSAPAQLTVYDACIDLHMYAGLNISGQQGSSYVLSYSTDLSNTNGWVPMATNTMGSSGWFYLDMDSPFSPHRFYKATLR